MSMTLKPVKFHDILLYILYIQTCKIKDIHKQKPNTTMGELTMNAVPI